MATPIPQKAVSNGIPPPSFFLPYPDGPELITDNLMKLIELTPDPRHKFLLRSLVTHLHRFVKETSLTTDEWMTAIHFLTRVGQKCTPIRQEFILLSDIIGISALVDAINNPPISGGTESSVLGPFFTDDAPDLEAGESIASEGKGEYLYVEGRVLSTDGTPIPGAIIETWETDAQGYYDTQYTNRDKPDCRGRLKTDKDGRYEYRAVVPVAYPIPGDGPVGEMLLKLQRHNMRPNHLHLMIEAPGYNTLTTALYPEGDQYLSSDAVFGVKKSLVVTLQDIHDEAEARKRGFPQGESFKLLQFDFILVPNEEAQAAREQFAQERAQKLSGRL
ncbi:aromatic compound dioxygenase [Laetiporus sulphureus 93-53]|uniref:Aromatic compound dioxygenase n=1 Tax=Laetiporus sulphureus 93-53 TaxID=1314785 RepID=A0A165BKG2_9APHY|nr:aromatic compound dioxygenase [Laetiporus sulphureus 93-53]KZT01219.1 aromatic compound dioxygenase [Laetiporus sulphureus 93-53]